MTDLSHSQSSTIEIQIVYMISTLYLINFDAIRLQAMRRRGVQMALATLIIAGNCRILYRERFTGQLSVAFCVWPWRRSARLPADTTLSQDTVCLLYCARLRKLVRSFVIPPKFLSFAPFRR
jgi:hypothetical protein